MSNHVRIKRASSECWYVIVAETYNAEEGLEALARVIAEVGKDTTPRELAKIIENAATDRAILANPDKVIRLDTYRPEDRARVVKCRTGRAIY